MAFHRSFENSQKLVWLFVGVGRRFVHNLNRTSFLILQSFVSVLGLSCGLRHVFVVVYGVGKGFGKYWSRDLFVHVMSSDVAFPMFMDDRKGSSFRIDGSRLCWTRHAHGV